MNEDLIKRSDAIKAMEQRYQDILRIFKRKVKDGERAIALDMIGCVKSLPSADRPQGEWIDKGWKGDWQFETDGRGTCWRVFECSLCNGESTSKTRFCPHCGAQMKGLDDEYD